MKKGLILTAFLLAIPSVSAQFNFGFYFGRPVSYLGVLNFANVYDVYSMYIDAIIFLLIFLGLGKIVFGLREGQEREEPGYKLIYIGLALLMTISLLVLESRMGISILEVAGSWVSAFLIVFLSIATGAMVYTFTKNKWLVGGAGLISFTLFFDSFYTYFGGFSFLGDVLNSLLKAGDHRLLYLLALVAVMIGTIKSLGLKKTEEPATPATPSEAGPEPTVERGVHGEEVRPATAIEVREVVPEEVKRMVKALQEDLVRANKKIDEVAEERDRLTRDLEEARARRDEEKAEIVAVELDGVDAQLTEVSEAK